MQNSGNGDILNAALEKRNTAIDNPAVISVLGVPLSKAQQKLLSKLPHYNSSVLVPKRTVCMKDLAALTASTGVEFAMFTKGGERLVIRGDELRIEIGEEFLDKLILQGYRLSGHTHPGIDYYCYRFQMETITYCKS